MQKSLTTGDTKIDLSQSLLDEAQASSDYKKRAEIARQQGDNETEGINPIKMLKLAATIKALKSFNESDHPRAAEGTSTGGQFVSGDGGGSGGNVRVDLETNSPIDYPVREDRLPSDEDDQKVSDWEKGLSSDQSKVLKDWTGNTKYQDIRQAQLTGEMTPEMENKIKLLNQTISTAPDNYKPVYRGMNKLSSEDVSKLANAEDIELNTLSSFSNSKWQGVRFADGLAYDPLETAPISRVLFEVKSSGKPLGKLISGNEREVVFSKGARFKVLGRDVIQTEKRDPRVLHLTLEYKNE